MRYVKQMCLRDAYIIITHTHTHSSLSPPVFHLHFVIRDWWIKQKNNANFMQKYVKFISFKFLHKMKKIKLNQTLRIRNYLRIHNVTWNAFIKMRPDKKRNAFFMFSLNMKHVFIEIQKLLSENSIERVWEIEKEERVGKSHNCDSFNCF